MPRYRSLTRTLSFCALLIGLATGQAAVAGEGTTFIFTSDPQFCGDAVNRVSSCRRWGRLDERVDWQIAGINRISEHHWPRNWRTRFGVQGTFNMPRGIVLGGDLTESAGGFRGRSQGGAQWRMFTERYEHDRNHAVRFPVYVGLGNHDLEIEPRDRRLPRDLYRDRMWAYVRQRHASADAPVSVDDFDPASHSYSWTWGGVHLVQLHRFGGDTRHELPSSLPWLRRNLERHASDGRPVVLFQHYGFESGNSIGRNPSSRSKWTPGEMNRLAEVLDGFNIIGLFHGHDHWSQRPYRWRGYDVFSPGAAHFAQFAVVHIGPQTMDVVYAEVSNARGDLRFVPESAFSKPVQWPARLAGHTEDQQAVAE